MKTIPFIKEHAFELLAQKENRFLRGRITPEVLERLEQQDEVHTVVREDGSVAMCCGIIPIRPGRAEAWSIMDYNRGREDFNTVFRIAKRLVEASPHKRVEATIAIDFKQGHRWIKLLGFQLEAERLRSYLSDGSDCAMYARIRE